MDAFESTKKGFIESWLLFSALSEGWFYYRKGSYSIDSKRSLLRLEAQRLIYTSTWVKPHL